MKPLLIISLVCAALVPGCKKKSTDTAETTGSGSAVVVPPTTGSAATPPTDTTGSAAMGSAATGSAAAGSADTGSATAGSAAMGSAATGSAAAPTAVADDEGHRNWDCKKLCKHAVGCKAQIELDEKGCETDCSNLAKDKGGRYARGSGQGARFYTCASKADTCDAVTACLKPAP